MLSYPKIFATLIVSMCKIYVLKTVKHQWNKRRPTLTKRQTMFMDWKTQYSCQFCPICSIDSVQSNQNVKSGTFLENGKLISKILLKDKGTKVENNFKIYYMTIIIKMVWKRTNVQIKGTESWQSNSLEKKNVFSINDGKIYWIFTCKTMNFNQYLAP